MTGHDHANTNFNAGERTLGVKTIAHLHHAWTYRHQLSGMVVADSRMFGVSPSGIVVLDARSGKRLHLFSSKHLGLSAGLMASGLVYAQGVLVVVTTQAIVALNAKTGKVLWRRPVTLTTNLLVAGRVVYVGSYCFNGCPTYALELRTGNQLWANPTGGLVQSVVAGKVYEGLLWHGYCQDRIFDARSGNLLTTLSSCGSWTGDALNTYGLVFPPDVKQPASVEPVLEGGKPGAWVVDVGRPDSTALVYAYRTLFAASARPHDGIVAVGVKAGKVLWSRAIRGSFHVFAANHLLYVLHRQGAWVDALRTDNGHLVRRFRIPGTRKKSVLLGGIVAGGQLYVSVDSYTVVMRP